MTANIIRRDSNVIQIGDVLVRLTRREADLIEFLALRGGEVVTKEEMLAYLYGGENEPEMKILEVFVCKIRRKLRTGAGRDVIETVWGRGYKLAA